MFRVDRNETWLETASQNHGDLNGILPLSPKTRNDLTELGVRVEIQDTRNAAAQFNLLATERGLQQVAAAFVPIGWKEGA